MAPNPNQQGQGRRGAAGAGRLLDLDGGDLPERFSGEGRMQPISGVGRSVAVLAVALGLLVLTGGMALLGEDPFGHLAAEDPGAEPGPADILVRRLRQLGARDAPQRLMLHESLGHIFREEGRYTQAARHYAISLELAETSSQRVQASQLLGLAELRLGHLSRARRHLENAVILGDVSSPLAVGVLHTLADVRTEMGHLAEAIPLYERALRLATERRDADEVVLLAADLSEAWARSGKIDEAFKWLERASAELDKSSLLGGPGADAAVSAKVASFLGSAHHVRGDVAKAIELYRKAMRAQAKVLRPRHPDLLATRLSLARAQRDQGDLEAALQAVEAVEATLRSGPQEGPDLSRALLFKSDVLREANRTEAARAAVEEAIRLQEACFQGDPHPEAAVALNSFGSILHDAGQLLEAHKKYTLALDINLKTVGPMHPETASTYNSIGTVYEDSGDNLAASQHFAKCLEIQLVTVGETSPDVANTYNNLATVLFRQGKVEDATALLRKALGILDAAGVPKGNPDRAVYQDNLDEIQKGQETQAPPATSGTLVA